MTIPASAGASRGWLTHCQGHWLPAQPARQQKLIDVRRQRRRTRPHDGRVAAQAHRHRYAETAREGRPADAPRPPVCICQCIPRVVASCTCRRYMPTLRTPQVAKACSQLGQLLHAKRPCHATRRAKGIGEYRHAVTLDVLKEERAIGWAGPLETRSTNSLISRSPPRGALPAPPRAPAPRQLPGEI